MKNRKDILRSPGYWLQDAQMDLYAQVSEYMKENGINQTQFASQLNVSKGYISQILNGNLNCTLRKLVELSLAIGKIPQIKYTPIETKIEQDSSGRVYQGEFVQGVRVGKQTLRAVYKKEANDERETFTAA